MKPVKNLKNLKNKIILLRVDYNVPINNQKNKHIILDDTRIEASLKTIKFLQKQGAKVVIISHLGRPNTRKNKNLTLKPVFKVLKKKLKINKINNKLIFSDKLKIKDINNNINKLKSGNILFLENIRFIKQEDNINKRFSKKFADLFNIFVLDAFSVSHRNSLTITEMPKYLPSYAGISLLEEVKKLDNIMHLKKFSLIIGGAKTETKLPVIKNLIKKTNFILIGGSLINNYLLYKKYNIGASKYSKYSKNFKKQDLNILENKKVILPLDLVIKTKSGENKIIDLEKLKKIKSKKICKRSEKILDIGPKTIQKYIKVINKSNSVIWNGPMGYLEEKPFHIGSVAVANAVINLSKKKAKTIVGGGETILLLKQLEKLHKINTVSTGGGAMLVYLSGKSLPGLDALESN